MKSEVNKKLAAAALLLALALVSFFPVAQKMSQPQTFSHAIESLDKKQETVLELTAASTAASASRRSKDSKDIVFLDFPYKLMCSSVFSPHSTVQSVSEPAR